jgi:hypothetical protein
MCSQPLKKFQKYCQTIGFGYTGGPGRKQKLLFMSPGKQDLTQQTTLELLFKLKAS